MSILKSLLQETSEYTLGGQVALEGLSCGNEVLEISDDYNEIVSMEDAIERLGEIHDSLEELLVISEDSLEEGGLDANTSQVLRISTEALVSPLGLDSPILSPESFGSDGERLSSTRVSIEEEKSTIQKVWDAIKRSLVALRQKISEWYNNVWKNVDKMLEKANKLDKAIDEAGAPKNDAKMDYSMSGLLKDGQRVDDVLSNITDLNHTLVTFADKDGVIKATQAALKKVTDLNAKKLNKENVYGLRKSLGSDFKSYTDLPMGSKGTGAIPKSMEVTGGTITKSGTLPGNKALYSIGHADIDKATWKVGPDDEGKDLKAKMSVEIPAAASLKSMNKEVKDGLELIQGYKKLAESVKKVKKEITEAGDKISKESKGTDDEKYAKEVLGFLRSIERMLGTPVNSLTALSVKTAGAVNSFIGSSLKHYEKK